MMITIVRSFIKFNIEDTRSSSFDAELSNFLYFGDINMCNPWRVLCLIFILFVHAANADIIAEDDFESGGLSPVWGDLTNASVADLPQITGREGRAMRFFFEGVDSTADSFAEARFDLEKEYTQLTIEFDMFVPANYVHRRPSDNTNNNKFFRLWTKTYDDLEKVGASMLTEGGGSTIGSDYRKAVDKGQSTAVTNEAGFITSDDKGRWMAVRIDVRAATDTSLGSIRVYKNGKLHLDDSTIKNHVSGIQGYRYGYLLGWANSGFSEDTIMYIDNVRFVDRIAARPLPPIPR